ncbi:MAG: cyclic-phosphate processing receiver domain-containing protein [Ruminiclostridium sp.]
MRLFIDDKRDFPKHGYECCRDADTAIMLLSVMKFEYISLDYDLGGDKSGLDILVRMKEKNIFVPEINIHSDHVTGRELMYRFCKENFPESAITMRTF